MEDESLLRHWILQVKTVNDLSEIRDLHLNINLTHIPNLVGEMVNLESLSLINGCIKHIQGLEKCSRLCCLDLSSNQIWSLENVLSRNPKLHTLMLDYNPISELKAEHFEGLKSLQTLSLCGTGLENLWSTVEALRVLPNLRTLWLMKSPSGVLETNSSSREKIGTTAEDEAALGLAGMVISEVAMKVAEDPTLSQHGNNFSVSSRVPQVLDVAPNCRQLARSIQLSTSPDHELSFTASDMGETWEDDAETESFMDASEDSEEEQQRIQDSSQDSGIQSRMFVSPICLDTHYRYFLIYHLPQLRWLDGMRITKAVRDRAELNYRESFEVYPQQNLLRTLLYREVGLHYGNICRRGLGRSQPTSSCSSSSPNRGPASSAQGSFKRQMFTALCRRQPLLRKVSCGLLCPRQFEYHPKIPDCMVFGTTNGEVLVLNPSTSCVISESRLPGRRNVLGLCWLHHIPSNLLAGCNDGSLRLFDINRSDKEGVDVVVEYKSFPKLTSVNVNSDDQYFLTSGFSTDIALYDLRSPDKQWTLAGFHTAHINVIKFANHSPHLFATSSFDRYMKLWDLRNYKKPIYTKASKRGNVMVCFSPNDEFLLTSAVDNEVRQYDVATGELHTHFQMKPANSRHNYTRSYYMNGGEYIVSGSCEETAIRLYNAVTGKFLRDVELGHLSSEHLYCQSLRGDPFHDFHFSVLVASNPPSTPSQIVNVSLVSQADNSQEDFPNCLYHGC